MPTKSGPLRMVLVFHSRLVQAAPAQHARLGLAAIAAKSPFTSGIPTSKIIAQIDTTGKE